MARDSSLAPVDVQVIELKPVLVPLPLVENQLPQLSLTSFSSHHGGRKCSHPLRRPLLRSARLLIQQLCESLMDLRQFSALREVDRDLLAQAVTRATSNPRSSSGSPFIACPPPESSVVTNRDSMHTPTVAMGPDLSEAILGYQVCE